MTLDIKRSPGRPKKMPDVLPQLDQAIREWESTDEVNVELKVTHSFDKSIFDDVIIIFGEIGGLILIYVLIIYVMTRIHP